MTGMTKREKEIMELEEKIALEEMKPKKKKPNKLDFLFKSNKKKKKLGIAKNLNKIKFKF